MCLDHSSPSVISRYDNIITFLRSPAATVDYTPSLPHSVQMHSYSTARLEALVALRDEARYLGLEDLSKLCVEELRTRQMYTRDASSGSIQSTYTVRERESSEPTGVRDSVSSTRNPRSSPSEMMASALHQRMASRERGDRRETHTGRSLRSPRPAENWL